MKILNNKIILFVLLSVIIMNPLTVQAITLPGTKNDIKNRMKTSDLIVIGTVVSQGFGLNIKVSQVLKGDKSYIGKVLIMKENEFIACGTGQPDFPSSNITTIVMFKNLWFSAYYDEDNFTETENIELKKTLSEQI